jgi:spoIIIJ-associated protein
MSEYKSFQGKQVDDAIAEACRHFKCTRENLEVEIVSGGSSGIFGLVGVKKAKIKARTRQSAGGDSTAPVREESPKDAPAKDKKVADKKPATPGRPKVPNKKNRNENKDAASSKDRSSSGSEGNGSKRDARPQGHGGQNKSAPKKESPQKQNRNRQPPAAPREAVAGARNKDEAVPSQPVPKPEIDVQAAREFVLESTRILLTNISEGNEIRIDMDKTPIEVVIEDEDNSGLIIGRDGQTISSMQYLLNRIVSRKFPGIARIQLDAGDYREKQDEQLRKTAQFLAEKAKTSRRTQSTRPLSSYHRRVVHMALQEDREIMTRSKGDGPMKRVLIMARRKKNANQAGGPNGNGSEPVDQGAMAEQETDEQVS